MANQITVAKLQELLSNYDPDCKVEVMYEFSTWNWYEDQEQSIEEVYTDWTSIFTTGQQQDGTILIGTPNDLYEEGVRGVIE